MKIFLFSALLLTGCATSEPRSSPLPNFLVGEWVSSDAKYPDRNAEPEGGFFLWLLADGRAGWLAAPEVGAACTTSYDAATGTLALSSDDHGQPSRKPTRTWFFTYDSKTQMLTLAKIVPPNDDGNRPQDYRKMKLTRHSTELTAYIRRAYHLP